MDTAERAERAALACVVATLNGATTIAATVAACARQADTYVVSDGSTDGTADVARAAGATVALELDSNVGKPMRTAGTRSLPAARSPTESTRRSSGAGRRHSG